MNTVHFIMQGKGGVGKSFVAYNLAQFLMAGDPGTMCIDTDPLTPTLCKFQGLHATYIQIADQVEVDLRRFDEMIENIAGTKSDVVIDTGSSTFLPLSKYLISNDIFQLLHTTYQKTILVHVVISAKTRNDFVSTTTCLENIATAFPHFVELIVWLNEFGGKISGFENLKVYHAIKDRLAAVVKVENPDELALMDIADMQNARMTYEEALASPAFRIVSRSRIFRYRKAIWEQLDALFVGDRSMAVEAAL